MAPFVLDEVANDVVDGLPQQFPISQYTLDRLRDPVQTFSTPPVIGREIADIRGRGGIAHLQLLEYDILQWMVAGIGIDLEISDHRMDNLVVRVLSASKNAELPLKNAEQLFYVAMLLVQDFNDHCTLLEDKLL